MKSRWAHLLLPFVLTAMALLATSTSISAQSTDESSSRRVIVLGFDGADPQVVRELMEAGALPNLKRLSEEGSFAPLATTNPAESPVSWASFSVGGNPGRTGIFDFLHRIPGTYIPDIALVKRSERSILDSTAQRWGLALGLGLAVGLMIWALGSLLRLPRRWARGLALVIGLGVAFAAFRGLEEWVPRRIPQALTARQGTPFWELAGRAGHRCSIVQVPVTFPAQDFPNGELLSGLGTPDVRATWGTYAIYAEDYPEDFEDAVNMPQRDLFIDGQGDSVTGGKLHLLEFPEGPQAKVRTVLHGPLDLTAPRDAESGAPRYVEPPLDIRVDRESGRVSFSCLGETVSAAEGEWSEWMRLEFRFNPLIKIAGMVRFHVKSAREKLYVYASPVNFDPGAEPLLDALAPPLSAPRSFSRELVGETGCLFETVGWAIATNPLKDEMIDEETFLTDLEFSFENRWRLVKNRLARTDRDLVVGVMLATDRVQHMFWRHRDPKHPGYRADAPARYREAIEKVYRRMDAIVGETMNEYVDENTDLFVISDHGFASFRRGVHINSWLVENGYMTLRDPSLRERGRLADIGLATPFGNVDWAKTRAYSLGLGKIYLNRRGREPEGIIETPEEAERLMDEIVAAMKAWRDPETGDPVVREVRKSSEIFSGPFASEAADLVVGFERGYRVSWDTAAGRAPAGLVEVNLNRWSGDHCSVAPSLVPGIFFSNRKLAREDPAIVDLARTILISMAVPIPDEVEGRDLITR
jgi:predicted AlkP superfamily phosphohydrolase/phosphomutase